MVRGVGFEPTNPYGTAASGLIGTSGGFLLPPASVDWEAFREWLSKEYMPVTAKDRFNYARKYGGCLLSGDLSRLKMLTDSQRIHAMKALSALSKFLGVYEEFKRAVKNYGLKWGGSNGDCLIIDRLTKTSNPNEVFEWVVNVKEAAPELCSFMDLITVTGIRYNEAIESYNLIVNLSRENKLNQYYNAEKQVLEHYRFKDVFIRSSKKLFISFVPEEVIRNVERASESLRWNPVKKLVYRRVKRLRFSDIREFWASYMTKYLSQPEIDFLQGRVSTSVFMRHYFNPAWIQDLRERTLRAAEEILEKITI